MRLYSKRNRLYACFGALALACSLCSCANYKMHYSAEAENWEQKTPKPDLPLRQRLYLVGDAGYVDESGATAPTLRYLKTILPKEGKNSAILFLGDNIYPLGMPPKNDGEAYKKAQKSLDAQLEALDSFKGRPIFVAGNHDWGYGLKGLARQEKIVEEHLNRRRGVKEEDLYENYFLPDRECPGPEVVELDEKTVVIALNTQWFLVDWDKHPGINADCDVRNRGSFLFEFENAIRKHRDKTVVVALHHPPYTYGPHGGKFSLKSHLFPLTELNPKLKIPLPVLGTLACFIRATIGSRQDVAHSAYKDLRDGLLRGAKKNGRYIFAAGHEHNLQYIEKKNQYFIVSGAGSKVSPAALGEGAEFVYGGPGYSVLNVYENGETWVQYWTPDPGGRSARMVFQKKVKDAVEKPDRVAPAYTDPLLPAGGKMPDSVDTYITRNKVNPTTGKLHRLVLGEHYRMVYAAMYKMPTLDLKTAGLEPLERGGGNQTNSLRLKGPDGRQYSMRDLTKDVSRLLPFPFNKMTAAKSIAIDNFLSTHPFAPPAVARLAEAAAVYHANPRMYYVPKQTALGEFNDGFGGGVYLLEERPAGDWNGTGLFGDSKKIINTPELTEKLIKNNKHKVDQRWALRSRLFDLLIGDWDRHDDQWRWARFEGENDHKIYRPVPRDRDQAFSRYDGLITKIAQIGPMPFLRQLQVYDRRIKNVTFTMWSARYFDRSFLNEMDWSDWVEEATFLQSKLGDGAIDRAYETFPETARRLSAEQIKSALRYRRDHLVETARKRYEVLARRVDVVGTDEAELFEIYREKDGHVRVRVFRLEGPKLEPGELVYERRFPAAETREIHLYGNGEDDEFMVFGETDQSILLRLVGGTGKDRFIDRSSVKGSKKLTLVYDDRKSGNMVETTAETGDRRNKTGRQNIYDRRGYHYEPDITVPLPTVGGNPDDGFTLGINLLSMRYKFMKAPYASIHNFSAAYAFGSRSPYLRYECDIREALGQWDFVMESVYRGPSYAFNYFGTGNDSKADFKNNGIEYYRVRQDLIRFHPGLKKRFAGNSGQIIFSALFDASRVQRTPRRFITNGGAPAESDFFNRQYFGGARMRLVYNSLDNWSMPSAGIRFDLNTGYINSLGIEGQNFGFLQSSFVTYQSLDRRERLVLATRLGLQYNTGNDFEFYYAPTLGGRNSLRGYRAERFYGKGAFWQNIDLRARLFSDYNKVLPFTLGLFGGFDYGRVWMRGEESDTWHYSYGGGIWISPVDVITLSIGVFNPRGGRLEDGPRFSFRIGMGL
jgi:Omp85 superfamily domain/Calcineurin-like phosphoesterase